MDSKTLALTVVLVSAALAFLTVVLASVRREPGLSVYAVSFVCGTLSFLLFLVQGMVTPWIGVFAANMFLGFFHIGMAWGLRLCCGAPVPWPRRFWAYWGTWGLVVLAATFVWDSYTVRAVSSSVFVVGTTLELMAAVRSGPRSLPRRLIWALWGVGGALMVHHGIRIALILVLADSGTRFMTNNPVTMFTLAFTVFFSITVAGLLLIIDAALLFDEVTRKTKILEALADTDELTGLANRHRFEAAVKTEMERASRYSYPLSLVMVDLDHFKEVNDTWGHQAGDEVLRQAADLIRGQIRDPDTTFRWGGEEFVLLVPHTDLEGALKLAEKIRLVFEAEAFAAVGPVTASLGVAEWRAPDSADQWFRQVDRALYRAKDRGRNRVVAWGPAEVLPAAEVRFEWRPEWASGNPTVDSEHKRLLEMANTLMDLILTQAPPSKVNAQLDGLFNHIQAHFATEEAVLREVGYPGAQAHAEEHRRLSSEARELRDRYAGGAPVSHLFLDFLIGKVVMGHLLKADVQFFPYTRRRR